MTYTFATLEVSAAAYDEIRAKLVEAGYSHAILPGQRVAFGEIAELIDMRGIALLSSGDELVDDRKPNILRANLDRCGQ